MKFIILIVITFYAYAQDLDQVFLYEKLGDNVSKDIVVYDSNGNSLLLSSIFKERPTLVTFNYYTCPFTCSTQLNFLAEVLNDTNLVLGKDYNIITISVDDLDRQADAKRFKSRFMGLLSNQKDAKAWKFLYVKDERTVRQITNSFGFGFQKSKEKNSIGRHEYYHPTFVTVVREGGKINRYLDGLNYSPFNIKLSIYESEKGIIGATIMAKKALAYCFKYDKKGGFAFDYVKIILGAILLVTGIFFIYLVLTTKTRKREDEKDV